jgi:hypothetical protein
MNSEAGKAYHIPPPGIAGGARGEVITKATKGPPPSWVTFCDAQHMENEDKESLGQQTF